MRGAIVTERGTKNDLQAARQSKLSMPIPSFFCDAISRISHTAALKVVAV